MKPGRELDELVAKVIGYPGRIPPRYSTSPIKVIELFEWLEQNHPWGPRVYLSLCRGGVGKESPTVRLSQIGEWEETVAYRQIVGESYPHAICKAVLLAKVETGF